MDLRGEGEGPTPIVKRNKSHLKNQDQNQDRESNQGAQPALFTKLEPSSATRGQSWRSWQVSESPAGLVESQVDGPAQCGGSGSGGLRSVG